MISEELQNKIDRSIKLLQSVAKGYDGEIEVAYSGGKDSDVILQLAKEAGIKYRAIYKNTTIDPPGTIKHAKDMGAEVRRPEKNFFQLVAESGMPNRYQRFCCGYLKEYKVLDKVIMGIRKSESIKRAMRYTEPTECKYYGRSKKPENHVEAIYPILDWTNDDVRDFILDRKIQCAPVYYDEQGNFHVERRLGCIGCPLASSKKKIEQFKQYPRLVRAYLRNLRKYFDNHPNCKSVSTYKNDVYANFTREVFYYTQSEWEQSVSNGLFTDMEEIDYKAFLEEQFGIDLTL